MWALILTLSQENKHILWSIINGNTPVRTKDTDNVSVTNEQPQPGTNDQRQQFMNYCLTHPGKFSCAVDCFLQLNYEILNISFEQN